MLRGTAVPLCRRKACSHPSERPDTHCCGERAGLTAGESLKEKTWLLDLIPALFYTTEGSSDVLLVWLSFSQGTLQGKCTALFVLGLENCKGRERDLYLGQK